jgi:hypothetical protein
MPGTIAEKVTYLNGTKAAIRDAIVARGVPVAGSTPFRDYAARIAAIAAPSSTGRDYGWNRPSDWPPGPPDDFPDNTCYVLYEVLEGLSVHILWRATTSGAGNAPQVQCTLRRAMPDAPPEQSPVFQTLLLDSGTREFDVNHADVPGAGANGRKYFWAKWEINPANLAANPNACLAQCSYLLNIRDTGERVMGLEVWLHAEKANHTSLGWSSMPQVRAFIWKGPNMQNSAHRLLSACPSLEYGEMEVAGVNAASYFLNDCMALRNPPSAVLDFSQCTSINYLVNSCRALKTLPAIVWPESACTYEYAFNWLCSVEGVVTIDVTNCASATLAFTNWHSAQGLRLPGAAGNTTIKDINLSSSGQMTCAAVETLIGDLADRTDLEAGTITLTGSDGIMRATQGEKDALVAAGAAKNWTVVLP